LVQQARELQVAQDAARLEVAARQPERLALPLPVLRPEPRELPERQASPQQAEPVARQP